MDFILSVNDPDVVAHALKNLMPRIPLDQCLENALDQRILALVDRGMAAKNAELAEAIALFLYRSAQERAGVARPYIPTLLSFLEQNLETTGAYSYYTLMLVARDTPDDFGPHADMLVRMLDSPGPAAKTFAMRIMTALAPRHPEYVIDARDTLRNLAETSPQGIIKAEAAGAYRAVREASGSPRSRGSDRSSNDPAIAGLYEMPVRHRAVEHHLSAACCRDVVAVDRPQGGSKGMKRDVRPSKRCNLYVEFVEKLKQGECMQSFEDQIDLLSQESMARAVPCEAEPVEATPPTRAPLAG